jgi:hypothetical protein
MGYLLTGLLADIIMDDVAMPTMGVDFCLYATGIRFANRESQRNMPAAGGDNFTDEFAQPSRPANNKCGNVIKFFRYNGTTLAAMLARSP